MPRSTLGDLKNSRAPARCGACADDPRFLQLCNDAVQRLVIEGHWEGCMARYRFCATDGCITLPRGIASIEGIAVCGQPLQIRDMLYEFAENGAGIRGGFRGSSGCGFNYQCGGSEAIFRGRFPTFSEITGTDKKLQVVCDLASDVGKPFLALGFDSSANWIRTVQSGVVSDGEVLALAQAPGTESVNFFTSVTDLQLPDDLDGQVWLWEVNTTTSIQRLIGSYQYSDTRPNMARFYFPGIRQAGSPTSPCTQTLVDAAIKLDFVPVKRDTDYLTIGNIPAVTEMMATLNKSENEPDSVKSNQIVMSGLAVALNLLCKEMQHYRGDATTPSINVVSSGIYADPIYVPI